METQDPNLGCSEVLRKVDLRGKYIRKGDGMCFIVLCSLVLWCFLFQNLILPRPIIFLLGRESSKIFQYVEFIQISVLSQVTVGLAFSYISFKAHYIDKHPNSVQTT